MRPATMRRTCRAELHQPRRRTVTKILFVGFDAAEPQLIERWAADGTLPTFARLKASSRWGHLEIPTGLSHGAAWASLYTGVGPGKHACAFGTRLLPDSYEQTPIDIDHDVTWEPLWIPLSRAGKRVAVIDMPKAPLTPDIHGIQVADWLTSGLNPECRSSPPALAADILRDFGPDPLGPTSDHGYDSPQGWLRLRDRVLARIDQKTQMTLALMEQGPWDLVMSTFGDPHDVGHGCWHLSNPNHPQHDAAWVARHGEPLRDTYVALDGALNQLLRATDEQTVLVLFAGPGICDLHTGRPLLDGILRRLEGGPEPLGSRLLGAARKQATRWLPPSVRRVISRRGDPYGRLSDRSRRRCFPLSSNTDAGTIRVNLAGRDPHGLIQPGAEYDAFCTALAEDLLALRNLDTDEPVVEQVLRVDQTYPGPNNARLAPDLVISWNRSAPIEHIGSPKIGTLRARYTGNRTGDHSRNTLFLIQGPGIAAGQVSGDQPVEALAPTIAGILGVTLEDGDAPAIALHG